MSKSAKILSGKKAQAFGKGFEQAVSDQGNREGFLVIKWPDGCRRVAGFLKLIPVKTPFDFTLISSGKAIFFDAKTFDKNTISRGDLVEHQINVLSEIEKRGFVSGYLVYFRKPNKVVFFEGHKLMLLAQTGSSLKWEDGFQIGTITDFELKKL